MLMRDLLVETLDPNILRLPIPQIGRTRYIPLLVDPGRDDLLALMASVNPRNRHRHLRGVHLDGHYYFWDGFEGIHDYVGGYLEMHLGQPFHTCDRITVWKTRRGLAFCTFSSPDFIDNHFQALLGVEPTESEFAPD